MLLSPLALLACSGRIVHPGGDLPGADAGADTSAIPGDGAPAPDGTGGGNDGAGGADAGGSADGGVTDGGGGGGDGSAPTGTPVGDHGQLSVSGNRIVDQSGQPVQLRGMSFGWSQWWGQYWTAGTVSWLVDDWKVEIVRAAMGVEMGGYLTTPDTERNKVIAVVDEAIARGIYVIIDWHDHNAPTNVDQSRAFFADMAQRYGQHANVIYEIFNEPEGETWPQIKAYAQDIVGAIRAHDPDNIVVVGTPNWSQQVDQAAADPVPGTNLAYTLHFYAATHKQWLRDTAVGAMNAGIALFVTEWGTCEASGTGYLDVAETDVWLQFMDDHLLSWANWDIADKDGETCSALLPNQSTTGGWPDASLTNSGRLVRGTLRAYAGF
jgi:endoglucanase